MRRIRTAAAVAAGSVALSVVLPMTAASAAGGGILNGDFETDPVGSTSLTGWTLTNGLVDLGVTELGGCTSVDTSSYDDLRNYADEAQAIPVEPVPVGPDDELYLPGTTDQVWVDELGQLTAPGSVGAQQIFYGTGVDGYGDRFRTFYSTAPDSTVWQVDDWYEVTGDDDLARGFEDTVQPAYVAVPDPTVRQDVSASATDPDFWEEEPFFASSLVDADTARDGDLAPATQALELRSDMKALNLPGRGYVAHGGAAVSDVYTTTGPRTVSLDWAASADEDDYHVLGYLLDVDTCQQTEVLDATGEASAWQTTSVDLHANGRFRFVFVSGTYDQTWGRFAGAVLYVDDIRSVPTVGTQPAVDVQPLFDVGHAAASAPVQLSGYGLQPGSDWTAEWHSDPVVFASGTADGDGELFALSTLPAEVEPGQHEIVLSGLAPDGSAKVDTVWVTVDQARTISYVSFEGAEVSGSPNPDAPTTSTHPATTNTPTTAAPVLANTGFDQGAALIGAVVLLALGGVALAVGRRTGRRV